MAQERGDLAVREHPQRDLASPGAEPAVAGREREEEIAARVRRRAAHARDAEADALGEPVALVR